MMGTLKVPLPKVVIPDPPPKLSESEQLKLDQDRAFYKTFEGYEYPDHKTSCRPTKPFVSAFSRFVHRLLFCCFVVFVPIVCSRFDVSFLRPLCTLIDCVLREFEQSLYFRYALGVLCLLLLILWLLCNNDVYIVDYGNYIVPEKNICSHEAYLNLNKRVETYESGELDFQERLACRSGIGDHVGLPDGILQHPFVATIKTAREEALECCSLAIEDLIDRTHLDLRSIDYLVVCCSVFNPTPSIASMLVSKYGMQGRVLSYNLSGMGCGCGVVAIDLCKDLLTKAPYGAQLLFVTHENITLNWYFGNDRSMLLTNTLFRTNGAAVLMTNANPFFPFNKLLNRTKVSKNSSNRNTLHNDSSNSVTTNNDSSNNNPSLSNSSNSSSNSNTSINTNINTTLRKNTSPCLIPRFRLVTSVRTTVANNDRAYHAIYQESDKNGIVGIRLSRDLFDRVVIGLNKNLGTLGLRCLPLNEKLKYVFDMLRRKIDSNYCKENGPFVPNFKTCFDHFCIHSGGRGIIDSFQKTFGLTDFDCLPSRASLYRFGNTSSSSVWYELNYIERDKRLKPGDKIWQVGFGSGVKIGSAVWEAL